MKGVNMAKLRCKQTVVYKQKQTLHTACGRNVIPESINKQRDSIILRGQHVADWVYFFELRSPSNSRHLACAGTKTTVRGPLSKRWHKLRYVWWKLWARLYLCLCVCLHASVPTSCQRSVSAGSPRLQWGQVCVWSGASWFLCPQQGPSLPHRGRHVEWEDQATPKWGRGSVWYFTLCPLEGSGDKGSESSCNTATGGEGTV